MISSNRAFSGEPSKFEAKPGDRDLESALESARVGYESVCAYALDFFDVYLKNHTGRRDELITRFQQTEFGGEKPHVEFLPVGATATEPYRDDANVSADSATDPTDHRRPGDRSNARSFQALARERTAGHPSLKMISDLPWSMNVRDLVGPATQSR